MKKRIAKTNNATINQTAATETATTNSMEEKEMKEKTLWATIKNGIKRAIKFVVDVLLFAPRVIFYGLSHMVTSLCLKASAAEDYDTDEYEFNNEEYPEAVIEKENEGVSDDAESPLAKKELRKQAKEERKETRKEAREARKEEKREAKVAAKEEKVAKAAVIEEVKAETTAEVIEEAKAEDTQVVEEVKAETTAEVIEEAKAEDTQVVEEFKVAAKEEKVAKAEAAVAAGENNQKKVAIVPESVDGEVVETTPAEVVETNQNASNNDSDASKEHKHNHPVQHEHICEFRKDDIGWKEVSSFMSMVNLTNDGNTLRAPSFVHPDRYMRYMRDITRPLLEAWCDRLGIEYQTMVGDENNRYMFAVAALEKCGEIDSHEAGELKARACNWYAGMYPIAYQSMEVIQGVIAKYFKRFYGTWVMYTEDFTKAMTSAQEYFSKNNVVPRLSQDEANKYFPIDESLKGINMEAPYVLGAMQH